MGGRGLEQLVDAIALLPEVQLVMLGEWLPRSSRSWRAPRLEARRSWCCRR